MSMETEHKQLGIHAAPAEKPNSCEAAPRISGPCGGQTETSASHVTHVQSAEVDHTARCESPPPPSRGMEGSADIKAHSLFDIIAAVDMVEKWKCSPVSAARQMLFTANSNSEAVRVVPTAAVAAAADVKSEDQGPRVPLDITIPRRKRSRRTNSEGGSGQSAEQMLQSAGIMQASDTQDAMDQTPLPTTPAPIFTPSQDNMPLSQQVTNRTSNTLPFIYSKSALKRASSSSPGAFTTSMEAAAPEVATTAVDNSNGLPAPDTSMRARRTSAERAGVRWRTAIAMVTGEVLPIPGVTPLSTTTNMPSPVPPQAPVDLAVSNRLPGHRVAVVQFNGKQLTQPPTSLPVPSFSTSQLMAWQNGSVRMTSADIQDMGKAIAAMRAALDNMQHEMRVTLTTLLTQANHAGIGLQVPDALLKLCEGPTVSTGPASTPLPPASLSAPAPNRSSSIPQPGAPMPPAIPQALSHIASPPAEKLPSLPVAPAPQQSTPMPPPSATHSTAAVLDVPSGPLRLTPLASSLPDTLITGPATAPLARPVPATASASWLSDLANAAWGPALATLAPTEASQALSNAVSDLLRLASTAAQGMSTTGAANPAPQTTTNNPPVQALPVTSVTTNASMPGATGFSHALSFPNSASLPCFSSRMSLGSLDQQHMLLSASGSNSWSGALAALATLQQPSRQDATSLPLSTQNLRAAQPSLAATLPEPALVPRLSASQEAPSQPATTAQLHLGLPPAAPHLSALSNTANAWSPLTHTLPALMAAQCGMMMPGLRQPVPSYGGTTSGGGADATAALMLSQAKPSAAQPLPCDTFVVLQIAQPGAQGTPGSKQGSSQQHHSWQGTVTETTAIPMQVVQHHGTPAGKPSAF